MIAENNTTSRQEESRQTAAELENRETSGADREPEPRDARSGRLDEALRRAEAAERELASLRQEMEQLAATRQTNHARDRQTGSSSGAADDSASGSRAASAPSESPGVDALRAEPMMAHLLDALEQGQDIGHYGRLVFAMVARHFLPEDEVVEWLTRDRDFAPEAAAAMIRQVEGRDYNPPRRERILEWQREQDFPILPDADDPDCGNVYRNLKFPDHVYEGIQEYQEKKSEAAS